MTAPGTSPADRIIHLRATLAVGKLPESQKKRGTALLERLTSPVRLAILGLPQSGKSELANLLLGRRVLPTGQGMPTCRLVWGPAAACRMTAADGSSRDLPWPAPAGHDWTGAVFAEIAVPVELLKSVSIMEVATDGSRADLDASLQWAVANTDMAIWCTQGMERQELAIWRKVPDALKDHSFMALTKADQLAVEGVLPSKIAELGVVAEEEFYGLYPVATLQYLSALRPDAPVGKQVRAASGAGGLIDAVIGDVRRGRQADLDGAEIFLSRYGVAEIPDNLEALPAQPAAKSTPAPKPAPKAEPAPQPAARAEPAPKPAPKAAGPAPAPAPADEAAIPTPRPAPRRTSAPLPTPAAAPEAEVPTPRPAPRRTSRPVEAAAPTPASETAPRRLSELASKLQARPDRSGESPSSKSAQQPAEKPAAAAAPKQVPKPAAKVAGLDGALQGLRTLGKDLAGLAANDDPGVADEILMLCMTRFEDMVSDLPAAGGELVDELEAASEAVILMQLDGGDDAAADAVTVVLQLTRELEMAQAA